MKRCFALALCRLACLAAVILPTAFSPAWAQSPTVDTFIAADLNRPAGLALDPAGTLYIADTQHHAIRRVATDGTVSTLAGSPGVSGHQDGTGSEARFNAPLALAVGPDGFIHVSDTGSHTIRRVSPNGEVTTLAGFPTLAGSTDGRGLVTRFNSPGGIAVDARGLTYVVDRGNRTIRTVTPDGLVSTYIGAVGDGAIIDGPASTARVSNPGNLAVDDAGNLFFAELWGHVVRRVTPWGHVTTIAGAANTSGAADGIGPQARFYYPLGVAVDRAGNVYVADGDNDTIRQITPAGAVTTIAGQPRVRGAQDGPALQATFRNPSDIAVDADGTVYVADTGNSSIRRLAGREPPRFTRYLAEGAATSFFSTGIALLNPGPIDTAATLTFLKGDGSEVAHVVNVPGHRRVTVAATDVAGLSNAEFSTVIESTEVLVVDRTMEWDATGYGAHSETAVVAPSPTWYFAEGATHSGFSLFYLLQNPWHVAIDVRVRYLRTQDVPLEKTYRLEPRSRRNIWVNVEPFDDVGAILASAEVSAVIESLDGLPIVAERAMYRTDGATTFLAGHAGAGVTTPAPNWFLAEGATGPYFDQFVLIANPTADSASVRLTYMLDDGQTLSRDVTVAAQTRSGVWVDVEQFDGIEGYPLADVAVSTTVEALNGVPLIVERAMWWPGSAPTWHEAHSSAGAVSTGTLWAVADGTVGGDRAVETYLLIANTSSSPGSATVTLHFEDGASSSLVYALPARSRTNVAVGPDFGASVDGRRFGATVESTGTCPAQIVVERAIYANAPGRRWAAGTNALAARLR